MRMPNLLHGLAPDMRERFVRELTAYLSSLRDTPTADPFTATRPSQIQAGEKLWQTLGCVACHWATAPESWLESKWNAGELARFLKDPSTVWPDGQMPTTPLSDDEARSLTAWLLRGQGRSSDGSFALSKEPGIAVDYFEGEFEGVGPNAKDVPTKTDVMADIGIPKFARADQWGTRSRATITIPTSGTWTLWLGSDDGSSLSLDGEVIIASPGVHGTDWKKATRTLVAGPHDLLVTYFEGAGNANLELHWVGPNLPRQRIPESAFTREAIALRSPSARDETIDPGNVAGGRALYQRFGCVNCHGSPEDGKKSDPGRNSFTPLAKLNPIRGCLADDPPADHPDYDFSPSELLSLRSILADPELLAQPLPASESLALHMLGLNCTGCHSREGVGHPGKEAMASFTGTADIGEQGRVPPTLDDAGAKLRTSAVEAILAGGGRVRPYMVTRMPNFGATASAAIPSLLAAADHAPRDEVEPTMRPEAIAAGTTLAGLDGLSCITCHGVCGYPSLGVPAVDLSYTFARLRHGWFDRYMRDPAAIYPGTRMPTFWLKGQRIHPEICGGDPSKQIDALWSYLSLGTSMTLPKGMVAGGEYALMPQSRPIVLGTFMDGLSARCFAVGFPEQIHFVYDGDHRRTAMAWKGKFMDAAGTWLGRAGLLCKPAGIDVIEFPPGDPVAVLPNAQSPWPMNTGRDAGWRFLGIDRDSAGVPIFRSSNGALYIEERLSPAPAVGGAHLIREFVIRAKTEPTGVMIRAWVATRMSSLGNETTGTGWKSEGGPTIFISGGPAFLQSQDQELLVPVGFRTGSDPLLPYEARIRLEYIW